MKLYKKQKNTSEKVFSLIFSPIKSSFFLVKKVFWKARKMMKNKKFYKGSYD